MGMAQGVEAHAGYLPAIALHFLSVSMPASVKTCWTRLETAEGSFWYRVQKAFQRPSS
jgi:hypothetical protein